MSVMITAEHFHLSEDERTNIADKFKKVEDLLKPDSKIHIFLKRDTKGLFRVVATAHSLGMDLAYKAIGTEFKALFNAARDNLLQSLLENKKRKIKNKRTKHGRPYGPPLASIK